MPKKGKVLLCNGLIELDAAFFHLCEFYTVTMYSPNIMGPHSVRKVRHRAHSKECGHTIPTLLKEMKVFMQQVSQEVTFSERKAFQEAHVIAARG